MLPDATFSLFSPGVVPLPEASPVDVPDAMLRYKVDGKIIEMPLDKTVLLAQQNATNARQVQSLTELKSQYEAQVQALTESQQQYEQYYERMLYDDAFRQQAADAYAEANSPERRAESAERKLAVYQQEQSVQAEEQYITRFASEVIMPALGNLAQQYEGVSEDVLLGQLGLYLEPLRRNGKLPHTALPQVEAILTTHLPAFAKAQSDRVTALLSTERQKVDTARAASQAAKRDVGKALTSTQATIGGTRSAPPAVNSANDVFRDEALFGRYAE
jgi:hypothetical protein